MSKDILETDEQELYKQIFKEFNKTKEDLEEYMNILAKWAESQPHLPEKPTYKTLRFLVLYNKFSIEQAKQKLDMYYTARSLCPEFFRWHPLSPEAVQHSKVMYCLPLPKVTSDFKRIYWMQINPKYGPDAFIHEMYAAQFMNLMELFIESDNCYNFYLIFDLNGTQIGHFSRVSPMILKKSSTIFEKVYSARVAAIYLVNFSSFTEHFINTICKPALNSKIRDRIQIHSSTDILLDVFGKSRMPKDIGGEERSLNELNDLLLQKYEQHKERFDKLLTMKVDESLRPEKLVNDEILGYYGNFRKINID